MSEDEPFLRRWARRKAESEAGGRKPDAGPDESSSRDPSGMVSDALPSLPAVETLNGGSDFSVFMARGVPRQVRNAALRRLWQVDPALGAQDGLVEYGEDFTDAAKAAGLVRTAFRIGHGMQSITDAPEAGNAESPQVLSPIDAGESGPSGDDANETPDAEEEDDPCADPPMRRRSS